MIIKHAVAIILISALLICTDCAFGASTAPTASTTPARVPALHDLISRYGRLSCAIVRITSDAGGGTGFFINGTGTIVTVAHVVFDQTYTSPAPPNSSNTDGINGYQSSKAKKGACGRTNQWTQNTAQHHGLRATGKSESIL
jgi:hypothetical protein